MLPVNIITCYWVYNCHRYNMMHYFNTGNIQAVKLYLWVVSTNEGSLTFSTIPRSPWLIISLMIFPARFTAVMDDATRRKIRGALCAILVSATE